MALLELQDVTYRYKNTNFIASLGSLEQGNPLYCPFLLA